MTSYLTRRLILLLTVFVTTVYLVLGTIALTTEQGWFGQNGHIFGFALTPEATIPNMMQVQDNNLQDFRILISEPWGFKRLVVFAYTIQRPHVAPHNEFGHALVEMRAGWSAIPGSLFADAPAPALITYATTQIDTSVVVYGKVLNPQVHSVAVTFDTGITRKDVSTAEGFFVSAPDAQAVREVHVLDAQGHVLQHYAMPDLHEPSKW